MTIGEKLSPVLVEIEDALWEYEAQKLGNPKFTNEGFRAALKIFMDVLLDRMWELQLNEKMTQNDAGNMALKCGEELKKLIHTYTGIDTKTLYDDLPTITN